MKGDIVVYTHPDGQRYVAMDEDGNWLAWPAVQKGWLSRQGCPATLVDQCEELPPKLADLALRLSGVPDA